MRWRTQILIVAAVLALPLVVWLHAAASYPSSVKSFAPRTTGQTIAGSWFNDLQDEVVAIEGGLLNGFVHALKPSTSGGQTLGTSGLPWGAIYTTGTINSSAASLIDLGQCNLRLTLTSGTAVTTSDVTAATSVYVTPLKGGGCAFYDGSTYWTWLVNSEVTIAVPASTSTIYDVWCRNNSGTIACDTTAWTNDTTRATALTTQNNVYAKTGDTTRRYVGSFRTTTVSGQTESSCAKQYVWNYYNRVRRCLVKKESTASWSYTSAAWHQANAAAGNQVDFVLGISETPVTVQLLHSGQQGTASGQGVAAAIGLDSTTVPSGLFPAAVLWDVGGTVGPTSMSATYSEYPGVGRHFLAWLEYGSANSTFFGVGPGSLGPAFQNGLEGWIEG